MVHVGVGKVPLGPAKPPSRRGGGIGPTCPPFNRSSSESIAESIAHQFIQQYYQSFDSDRSQLLHMYVSKTLGARSSVAVSRLGGAGRQGDIDI
jgi:hypothetical protein